MFEKIQSLCTFEFGNGVWQAHPQRPFRPRGLVIWDAPPGSTVSCTVGTELQLSVDWPPIPARWFQSFATFEQIAKAIDEAKEPPGWGTWDAVEVGEHIRLRLVGADSKALENAQVLMWGHSVRP